MFKIIPDDSMPRDQVLIISSGPIVFVHGFTRYKFDDLESFATWITMELMFGRITREEVKELTDQVARDLAESKRVAMIKNIGNQDV